MTEHLTRTLFLMQTAQNSENKGESENLMSILIFIQYIQGSQGIRKGGEKSLSNGRRNVSGVRLLSVTAVIVSI